MVTSFRDLAATYMDTAEKLHELRRLTREAADEHQAAGERLAALTASLTMEAQPLGSNDTARRAALEGLKADSQTYQALAATVRDLARSLAQFDAGAELLGHTLRVLRLRMEWEIATAAPPTAPSPRRRCHCGDRFAPHWEANGAMSIAEMVERR